MAFFFSALRPRGWTFIDARSLPVLRRRVAQQFGQVPDERLLFRNTNALPNGFDRPVGRLQQLLGREKPLLANIGQHRAARFLAKHLDKPVLRCTQRICDIRWPKLLVEVLADIVSGIQKKQANAIVFTFFESYIKFHIFYIFPRPSFLPAAPYHRPPGSPSEFP